MSKPPKSISEIRWREPGGPPGVKEHLRRWFQTLEDLYDGTAPKELGVPTGYPELDLLTGGLVPGRLTLLAGVPGAGKTALALNLARNLAAYNRFSAVFFSLQDRSQDVLTRLLAAEARVEIERLNRGELRDAEWPALTRAAGTLAEMSLRIDDRADLSPKDIRASLRDLPNEERVSLVAVDHLLHLRPDHPCGVAHREFQTIVHDLQHLACDLHLPVLLVVELVSRLIDGTPRRPALPDLAALGLAGREADSVWVLHPSETETTLPEDERPTVLHVPRQPHLPPGEVHLLFSPEYQTFSSPLSHPRRGSVRCH